MNEHAGSDGTSYSAGHRLTERVALATLQELQDHFARLGRMTACITTVEGQILTRPTWGSRFSELVATSRRGARTFNDHLRTLSREGPAPIPPVIHEGMELHATPISSRGEVLAVLIVGTRLHPPLDADRVAQMAAAYDLDRRQLRRAVGDYNPARGGTPADIQRFAASLARMIASMFEQAERVERQLANLRTVHDLSHLLAGTLDLQEILDKTVQRVADVMRVKACAIRLLDPDTGELVIKAVYNLSREYLEKGAVLISENAIDAEAFAGRIVYIADARTDRRIRFPQNARREGIVSGLCAPLAYRGQTIGVIRVYTSDRRTFSETEAGLLRSIGSQAASAIIHSRHREEQAHTDRVRRQLEIAEQVQRQMLPAAPPVMDGLDFGCVYDPSLRLSGDLFDFIPLPTGDQAVAIADVVGKGVPAALLMAAIRSTLRAFAPLSDDATRIVQQVNRQLCRDTLASEFATLFYGVISQDIETFIYCNAGHPPPVLLRHDAFMDLGAGGMAIGILPAQTYESGSIRLQPGDTIAMVTDGVTEAMSFEGRVFGRKRLLQSVLRHRGLSAQQLAGQILWDVRRFVGLAEQSDDITIVTIQVL